MTTDFTPSKTACETREVTHPVTGRRFMVEFEFDNDSGPPQSESDGHGHVVTPGFDPKDADELAEIIEGDGYDSTDALELHAQCAAMRHIKDDTYYDVWRSLRTAKREGWGPTPEAAVEADFKYIYGWYNDLWYWCGIRVTPVEVLPGEALDESDLHNCAESLWGIESNDENYHKEVIAELLGQCEYALRDAQHDPNQLELDLTNYA